MAWAFGDGFDCYTTGADAILGYWDSGSAAFSISTGRFSGSRAINIANNSAVVASGVKSSGVNDAVHHISFAFQQTTALTGTTIAGWFTLYDGTTAQCSIGLRSDGAILLIAGVANSGTTLATYTGAFPVVSTWYQFEIEVLISNTAGYMKVRKNGNTTEDFTSSLTLDTQATANAYANKIGIGSGSLAYLQHMDDLYWRSDASSVPWLGDIRCYTRMPASDAAVQFSRTTGASNFSCVDEPQQNAATDYVFSSTPGQADLYGIAPIASTPLTTFAVTTRAYAIKSDAGTRTMAVQLKSGGTTVASPTLVLTPSNWQWAWRHDTTDPATGAAWSAAAVNVAQVGPVVIA